MKVANPKSVVGELSVGRQADQAAQLDAIAEAIKKQVELVEDKLKSSVKHALLAGKHLCRAKKIAGHGNWLEWFGQAGFEFSETTAQRYMRLYRKWPEVCDRIENGAGVNAMRGLTMSGALGLLATVRKDDSPVWLQSEVTADLAFPSISISEPVSVQNGSEKSVVEKPRAGAANQINVKSKSEGLGKGVFCFETDIELIRSAFEQFEPLLPEGSGDQLNEAKQALMRLSQHFKAVPSAAS